MNVNLTPTLERFISGKIKAGYYTSASEVVREALRLLVDHDKIRTNQLNQFQQEIDRRILSLDSGKGIDGDKFFAQLKKQSKVRRSQKT
jgi:antitoxin ParD1/3/4